MWSGGSTFVPYHSPLLIWRVFLWTCSQRMRSEGIAFGPYGWRPCVTTCQLWSYWWLALGICTSADFIWTSRTGAHRVPFSRWCIHEMVLLLLLRARTKAPHQPHSHSPSPSLTAAATVSIRDTFGFNLKRKCVAALELELWLEVEVVLRLRLKVREDGATGRAASCSVTTTHISRASTARATRLALLCAPHVSTTTLRSSTTYSLSVRRRTSTAQFLVATSCLCFARSVYCLLFSHCLSSSLRANWTMSSIASLISLANLLPSLWASSELRALSNCFLKRLFQVATSS